ncbi:MAG: glycosyltransferase, partial [Muribaculaceae bacterium]|nr:glycosyltransferase [Muribaculaceae bacterium]
VGTGTKRKVLDAFANGLMVIGTPLALENIAVAYGLECACYTDGLQLAQWLSRLADNPAMINSIARAGNAAVLREHSRQSVARTFFHLFE